VKKLDGVAITVDNKTYDDRVPPRFQYIQPDCDDSYCRVHIITNDVYGVNTAVDRLLERCRVLSIGS
jgi:hypothetical protein